MTEPRNIDAALGASLRSMADSVQAPTGLAERLLERVSVATDQGAWPATARSVRHRWFGRWMVPLVSAAAIVTVVAAAAAIHARLGSGSISSGQSRDVVPWRSAPRPVDPAGLKHALSVGGPAGTRDCTGGDFTLVSASSTPDSNAPGFVITRFVLRSDATSGCVVSRYGLESTIVDATGRPLVDGYGAMGAAIPGPDPLVRPGQFLSDAVHWAWYGGHAPRPAKLLPLARNTGTTVTSRLAIPLGGVDIPRHPAGVSSLPGWQAVWWSAPGPTVSNPGAMSSLVVVLHPPPSVRIGHVLAYTIELQNPTDTAVRLEPCPELNQVFETNHIKSFYDVTYQGSMNCAQAPPAIPPHSSVTFAMRLDTQGPSDTTIGALTWALVVDGYWITGSGTTVPGVP